MTNRKTKTKEELYKIRIETLTKAREKALANGIDIYRPIPYLTKGKIIQEVLYEWRTKKEVSEKYGISPKRVATVINQYLKSEARNPKTQKKLLLETKPIPPAKVTAKPTITANKANANEDIEFTVNGLTVKVPNNTSAEARGKALGEARAAAIAKGISKGIDIFRPIPLAVKENIIRDIYYSNITRKEVSEKYGISLARVRTIIKQALEPKKPKLKTQNKLKTKPKLKAKPTKVAAGTQAKKITKPTTTNGESMVITVNGVTVQVSVNTSNEKLQTIVKALSSKS